MVGAPSMQWWEQFAWYQIHSHNLKAINKCETTLCTCSAYAAFLPQEKKSNKKICLPQFLHDVFKIFEYFLWPCSFAALVCFELVMVDCSVGYGSSQADHSMCSCLRRESMRVVNKSLKIAHLNHISV